MRQLVRNGVRKVVNTAPGLKFLKLLSSGVRPEHAWVLEVDDPQVVRKSDRFSKAKTPQRIDGFEDLAFMFSSWRGNRGIARLDFDEAAYLFRLVKSLESPSIVEIGRFKGGSTFIMASAMRGGRLLSIDLHITLNAGGSGHDQELSDILQKTGLREKVDIVVGDSRAYANKSISTDLLFIDGDHSYEGVRADYLHWVDSVKKGGHVVFHDDHTNQPGVYKFIREIEKEKGLSKKAGAGSLTHFVKL